MSDLPLEVRQRHMIEIDNPDRSDTRCGQIEDDGAAQSAGPHYQYARCYQPGLAGASHLAQHNVPGIAFEFFIGQSHGEWS
jgi:hypothetical protein